MTRGSRNIERHTDSDAVIIGTSVGIQTDVFFSGLRGGHCWTELTKGFRVLPFYQIISCLHFGLGALCCSIYVAMTYMPYI